MSYPITLVNSSLRSALTSLLILLLFISAGVVKAQDSEGFSINDVDMRLAPTAGNPTAKVTLIEYMDFQCGHCRDMHTVIAQLAKDFGDKVFVVYKPFVRSLIPDKKYREKSASFLGATGALAANRQGKYAEMSTVLFDKQVNFDPAELTNYATAAGLDLAQFEKDRMDPAIMAAVERNRAEAMALNVIMTPSYFLNGKKIEGEQSLAYLTDAVNKELSRSPGAMDTSSKVRDAETVAVTGQAPSTELALGAGNSAPSGAIYESLIYQPGTLPAITTHSKLRVGKMAPDFTLKSVANGEITLSDYRGKKNVVVSFVPAAWTPVCTGQWPHYIESKKALDDLDTVVLGITEDNIPTLYAWTKTMPGINFPVLSDFWPHGKVAKKYGVLRPESGTSERAIFIIDKEGRIRYIDVHDINDEPLLSDILKELNKLK